MHVLNSCLFIWYLTIIIGCTQRNASENYMALLKDTEDPGQCQAVGSIPLLGVRAVFWQRLLDRAASSPAKLSMRLLQPS